MYYIIRLYNIVPVYLPYLPSVNRYNKGILIDTGYLYCQQFIQPWFFCYILNYKASVSLCSKFHQLTTTAPHLSLHTWPSAFYPPLRIPLVSGLPTADNLWATAFVHYSKGTSLTVGLESKDRIWVHLNILANYSIN